MVHELPILNYAGPIAAGVVTTLDTATAGVSFNPKTIEQGVLTHVTNMRPSTVALQKVSSPAAPAAAAPTAAAPTAAAPAAAAPVAGASPAAPINVDVLLQTVLNIPLEATRQVLVHLVKNASQETLQSLAAAIGVQLARYQEAAAAARRTVAQSAVGVQNGTTPVAAAPAAAAAISAAAVAAAAPVSVAAPPAAAALPISSALAPKPGLTSQPPAVSAAPVAASAVAPAPAAASAAPRNSPAPARSSAPSPSVIVVVPQTQGAQAALARAPQQMTIDSLLARAPWLRGVPEDAMALLETASLRHGDKPMRNLALLPPNLDNPLTGYVFMCNTVTFSECISRMLLGTTYATGKSALPRIIPQYTQLFLYNMDEQHLYAVFEATEPGAVNIEPYAWTVPWIEENGQFPVVPPGTPRTRFGAQVKVALGVFFEQVLTRADLNTVLGNRGRLPLELKPRETVALLKKFVEVNKAGK